MSLLLVVIFIYFLTFVYFTVLKDHVENEVIVIQKTNLKILCGDLKEMNDYARTSWYKDGKMLDPTVTHRVLFSNFL